MACNRLFCVRLWVGVVIGVTFFSFSEEVNTQRAIDTALGWLQNQSEHLDENLGTPSLITAYTDEYDVAQFYVVSLEPEGYLVLSTDDLSEPVLAFSDTGTFDESLENPLYALVVHDSQERKDAAETSEFLANEAPLYGLSPYDVYFDYEFENIVKWVDLEVAAYEESLAEELVFTGTSSVTDVRVAPIIQSQWSQGSVNTGYCWNYYTPSHSVSGCVATAIAMILRHHEYPTTGIGQITKTCQYNSSNINLTTRGGDGSGGAYNWSLMPHNANGASDVQRQMIGSVTSDAGIAVNMMYTANSSGAYISPVPGAFKDVFQYANAVNYYSHTVNTASVFEKILNTNLMAGYPVFMAISRSQSGHAVVADGFGYSSGTMYHHVNMGWGGNSDAWYNLPLIDGAYQYTAIYALVCNIFPDKTGEIIAGRVTDSEGAGIGGVTVTATGGHSDTTDSKGYYGIVVPANNTYNVTATLGAATQTVNNVSVTSTGYSTFGGTDSVNFNNLIQNFSFSACPLETSVFLRWATPGDCGSANNTVYIRRKTGGFPTGPSDGTQVYTGTAATHEDTGLTPDTEYFYRIWWDDSDYTDPTAGAVQQSATPSSGAVKIVWHNTNDSGNLAGSQYIWQLKANGELKSYTNVSDFANTAATGWRICAMEDVNGDGASDIIWHNTANSGGLAGLQYVWFLGKDGVIESYQQISNFQNTAATGWTLVGCGRFDRNGTEKLGLIWHNTANSGGLAGFQYVWFLNTDGTLDSYIKVSDFANTAATGWNIRGIEDVDNDGTDDLIWHNTANSGSLAGLQYVWFLNTDGTLKSFQKVSEFANTAATGWQIAGIGRFDKNGANKLGLIWHNTADTGTLAGKQYVWFLNTDGTLSSYAQISNFQNTQATGWNIKAIADIDKDGNDDIIWHNTANSGGLAGLQYVWFLNSDSLLDSYTQVSEYANKASTG